MENKNIPYKIYLEESELPKSWYNLRADMNDCGIVKTNEGDFMEIC